MKRVVDVSLSLMILIILLPIIAICAVLIRSKLGSPILFRQKRPGLFGRPFYIYKFRTMTDSRDTAGNLLPDYRRMTPFGSFLRKFSLDELPQLINVLKGELSLVGPRPLLMEYLPLYTDEQARRHLVKPGITGWAQINGRNAISWEEKFTLDVWYVDHQTFFLDVKILLLTIGKVVRRSGINQSSIETMENFTGSKRIDQERHG